MVVCGVALLLQAEPPTAPFPRACVRCKELMLWAALPGTMRGAVCGTIRGPDEDSCGKCDCDRVGGWDDAARALSLIHI